MEQRILPPTFRPPLQDEMPSKQTRYAEFGELHVAGFAAWFLWVFVHLMYLVEFENRILVFVQWVYDYFTRNRGARLITRDFIDRASK